MKKYVLLFAFLLGGLYGHSQDLDAIKLLIDLTQYEKAKDGLVKFMADPKNANNPRAWYFKAYVYNALGRDPKKTVAESKSLNDEAFAAIKKYTELDPKTPFTKEENNSTVYNLYYAYYELGVKMYNDKNYAESFNNFRSTLEVHDYIYNNKLIGPKDLNFSAHDTDIVWNLAVLAGELKKKDQALVYFKMIADAGLSDEKYAGAYDDLILSYKREKNAELFYKYLAAAKKYYPVDKPYWESQQIEFALKDLENEALLNKYEELLQALPDNYIVSYNYAVDIDKFITSPEAASKDKAGYKKKMEELFKKAIAINSTIEANLQLANMYYSKSFEIQEQAGKIKGTKPEEVKLKKELNESVKTTLNQAIPYAEEAIKLLAALKEYKFADKANYKLALEVLTHAYKLNGNAAKLAEYEKKKAEVDKL